MLAIINQLDNNKITLPEAIDGEKWCFSQHLKEKDNDFFKPLVQHHLRLKLLYDIQSARLLHDMAQSHGHTGMDLRQQAVSALMMAELLEVIYRDYLHVPREIETLQKDQLVLRRLLNQNELTIQFAPIPVCQHIRDAMATLNWPRLFTFRIRRLLLTLQPLTSELSQFWHAFNRLNQLASPALSYFSWLFFIPRLTMNLAMLAKHTLPENQQQESLGVFLRLSLEWEKRRFEIANDAVWMSANLINCFVLTGALSPYALCVSITLQTFDLVMACARLYVDMERMRKLNKQYNHQCHLAKDDPHQQHFLAAYQTHLSKRITHEEKVLILNIINKSALVISMMFAVPGLSLHPAIPVIAAALAVTMTLVCFLAKEHLGEMKPPCKLSALSGKENHFKQLGFFHHKPTHSDPQIPAGTSKDSLQTA